MNTNINIDVIKHSAAHLLAMAALRLFPGTKLGIGPVNDDGFYHEFQFPIEITWSDVERLEQEMLKIIQEDLPFVQAIVPREQAYNILLIRGQVFKTELLDSVPDDLISFYKTGEEFIDLCRGPHVASTSQVGAIKLTLLEKTHWKGESDRPNMQKISGVAFHNDTQLKKYLSQQDQINKIDYKKYAAELGLKLPGSKRIIYTATGHAALNTLSEKIVSHIKEFEFYQIGLPSAKTISDYLDSTEELFSIKNRSYRELPFRIFHTTRSDLLTPYEVCDKEFYTLNSIQAFSFEAKDSYVEVDRQLRLAIQILKQFNLPFTTKIYASSKNGKAYETVNNALNQAIIGQVHIIDATLPATVVSVEFILKDSLGRDWEVIKLSNSTSNNQYVSKNGEFTAPNITQTHIGLEVFLAYFLESGEGTLPFWLSPTQICVIPITDMQHRYADEVTEQLLQMGYRAQVDKKQETMQARLRLAEIKKIPVIIMVGEKEEKHEAVSIRLSEKREIGMVARNIIDSTLQELGLLHN